MIHKIELKNFSLQNIMLREWKDKLQADEKIIANYVCNKELVSRMYKEVLKLNNEKWTCFSNGLLPETDPHIHSQLNFDKGVKAFQWRKESLLNKRCWNNWTPIYKKMNLHIDVTFLKKRMKKGPTSYVIMEFQIKTQVRYHGTPIRMAGSQNWILSRIWSNGSSNSLLRVSHWDLLLIFTQMSWKLMSTKWPALE